MNEEPRPKPQGVTPAEFEEVRRRQEALSTRVTRVEQEVDALRREAEAMVAEQRMLQRWRRQEGP